MMTNEVLDALEQVVRGAVGLTSASVAAVAPRSDLTLTQWRALAVLAERSRPTRVGEVAAKLRMSLPSTSRLVRRLERHGYVTTARDEDDRRVTLATVTTAGAELWGAVVRHRRAAMARQFEGRAPMPADLARGLEAIASGLAGLA